MLCAREPEKEVALYLKEKGIRWEFQFPIFIYEKERPRLWSPDFYLPTLGLFLEVCGKKRKEYEYRKEIYEKNGIPVIFLQFYKDPTKWKYFLAKSVEEIEKERKIEAEKLS